MDSYDLTKRRNLLITSIILFLVSFSEMELGNNISLTSGIKITIKDPIVIYIIIWGMYAYFFIRFFQCLIDRENKIANDARELLALFNPPLYELNSYDNFNGYTRKIRRLFIFFFVYIERLIILVIRSLFGKSFFEYLFPIIFALFVGVASCNSPFMKTKKADIYKLISDFWCGTKHTVYDLFLPDYFKNFENFRITCGNNNL